MRKLWSLSILVPALVAAGCGPASDSASKPSSAASGNTRTGATPTGTTTSGAEQLKAPLAGALAINPGNSKIDFVGSKPDGKHDGGFKEFLGGIELAGDDVTAAKISVEIDTNSLWADNPKLTNHLKSPDFFDVKTYPKASFKTTAIKAETSAGATHTITGELTLHGVTKPISFPAKIELKPDVLSLNSEFKISRKEFGIAFAPDKVDDPVTIKVSVNAPRK